MTTTVESPETPAPPRESGGDGVGIASFVLGAIGAGPLAIALGLWGLARYRAGRAARRSWPLAGLVLGVIGTLVAGTVAYLYFTSDAPKQETDLHAQVDVINVGNALVDHFTADLERTSAELEVGDEGYTVAGLDVPASLETERSLDLDVTDAYVWCVTLTYAGGLDSAVAFDSATGFVPSGECPAS